MEMTFFFDSYALFELFLENPNYEPYKTAYILTSKFHLLEYYCGLLRTEEKIVADDHFATLISHCVEISEDALRKAAVLKNTFRKRNLSYIDCVGYVLARSLNLKFLTGDQGFADFENVEFVK